MMDVFGLSERELEILRLLANGASNKEIASRLVISTNTVKVHLRNIYAKLNVNSRTEAVMLAIRNDLVSVEGILSEGNLENRPQILGRYLPFLQSRLSQGRHLSWFLTLGLVGVLVVAIVGMLILVKQGENGFGVGGSSDPLLEKQRWRALAGLPTARKGLAVTAFENQIYAIGGETRSGVSDFVERFDPQTNTWERLANKPMPVTDVHAVVIGGLIYIPGGQTESGEVTDLLEVFDPRNEQWVDLSPLPVGLCAYASVAFEGRLYIFGGWDGEKVVDTVFVYDPQSDLWTEGTPMHLARSYAEAEISGGAIYVMGGFNDTGPLDINEVYTPQYENTGEPPWQEKSPMPEGRYAFGLIGVADILHIVGGVGTDGPPLPYKYFPQEDTWQTFTPPSDGVWSHLGISTIESHLYTLGGQRGDRISDENLAYQAIFTITLPLVK